MEGHCQVVPVTGLKRPNTGKVDNDGGEDDKRHTCKWVDRI
jgi:hypothetical protein